MKPSALIVGCGRIAGALDGSAGAPPASHASAYKAAGVRVAGCMDVHSERARALARRHGIPRWGADLRGLLDLLRPDVVSICTPDDTHARAAQAALSASHAPRVLFVEKPICRLPRELADLKRAAARRGTRVVVNHSRRFDRRYLRLRTLVRSGRLGPLARADVFYYGGWRHNGVHAVDTLRLLTGAILRPLRVVERQRSRHPDDPTLGVELAAGAARAHLHPFDERRYQIFDLDLKFAKGRVRIEDFESRWSLQRRVRAGGENILEPARWNPGTSPSPLLEAARLISRFLRGGSAYPLSACGLGEAGKTMDVIWGAR